MPSFTADLLRWFRRHRADLPWRRDSDPYRVWLSEIMLQQTQVAAVIPYYERFLRHFPNVQALAAAPLDEVLKLWEGLGYYSRARNLHRAAQAIVQEHGGRFPQAAAALEKLPGIGRYTAGAVASIAFGQPAPVVDGNVVRVLARLLDLPEDVTQAAVKAQLWQTASAWLPRERPGDYNQALMELGRVICKPRRPRCAACPVRRHCLAAAHGTQAQRPVKTPRAPVPHYDVTAGLIWDGAGRLLIAQRPPEGLLGGLWEFPGGKQEPGETLPQTLARELREELAIEVEVGDFLVRVKHAFTHFRITLHAYECRHVAGEPQALGVASFAWVTPDELDRYAFGKADQGVIAALRERPRRLL